MKKQFTLILLYLLTLNKITSYAQGVAINTTGDPPSVMLHVTGQNANNNTTLEILRIDRSTTHASNGAASIAGALNFRNENSAAALTLAAGITATFDVATAGFEEGSLLFFYGKNNVLTEGMRLDGTAGFVGINATTPPARLTVVEENLADNTTLEALRLQRINTTASTGGAANIGVSQTFFLESSTDQTFVKGGSIDVILEDATSGSHDGSMQFMVAVNGATTEYMRVDGTFGFVGIGTTAPVSNLNVASNPASNSTILQLLTITRQTTDVGNGANGIGSEIAFELEDGGAGLENAATIDVQYEDATNGSEKATMSFGIKQAGSITELLRLDGTDKNVGIGQSNPTAKLHVFGSDDGNNTMPMLRLERLRTTGNGAANNGGAIQYFLEDDAGNSETMASLDAVLDVATNAGNAEEATLRFLTKIGGTAGVAEQMRIDGTKGYVGIGVIAPNTRLHVLENVSTTNLVEPILTFTRSTSGLAANGIGSRAVFELEDNAGILDAAGKLDVVYERVNNTTEDASMRFSTMVDGTSTELMRLTGDGTATAAGGYMKLFGGLVVSNRGVGVNTTLNLGDFLVVATSNITITLPATAPNGQYYIIKRNTGAGNVTVARNGNNIDGAGADYTIATDQYAVGFIFDGVSWWTVRTY